MKKIIIENAICSNTGDMAIVVAIEKILNETFKDGLDITIYDNNPEACQKLYPSYKFKKLLGPRLIRPKLGVGSFNRWKSRLHNKKSKLALNAARNNLGFLTKLLVGEKAATDIQEYMDADAIITTGGTYLQEEYDLGDRISQFQVDLLCNKKTIFFTQTLGPFTKDVNKNGLSPAFNNSPLIMLRDQRSYENLKGIVNEMEKCHVMADCVYALADNQKLKLIQGGQTKDKLEQVAISVRHWPYFHDKETEQGMTDYRNAVAALTEWLVNTKQAKVTFLSTCQGIESYTYDDSSVGQDIFDMLDAETQKFVTVDSDFHSPQEIMDFVSNMDLVVATRMHMAILSLCVGTPVLPIAYEAKHTGFAQNLGIENLMCDINTVTAEDLIANTTEFLDNLPTYHAKTAEAVIKEYNSAMQASSLLKKVA